MSYSSSRPAKYANITLRRLDQEPYDTIQPLDDCAARKFLQKHLVIPAQKQKLKFACWECGESLSEGQGIFRCESCPKRPRLHHADLAFTPLSGHVSAGWDPDYAMLLRSAYAIGCKLPLDSAVQMIRRKTDTVRYAEDMIGGFYKKIKVALAYSEVKLSKQVVFTDDVVEPDSGRFGKTTSKKKEVPSRSHVGA